MLLNEIWLQNRNLTLARFFRRIFNFVEIGTGTYDLFDILENDITFQARCHCWAGFYQDVSASRITICNFFVVLRSGQIGTFDLSDILGHNKKIYFTLRCRAGFFDFRFLPDICQKLSVFRQRKISKISEKSYVPIPNGSAVIRI